MAQFTDGKDDDALRTIGEVSEALNIKPHVLRYWEQQFPLLDPLKRSGGRRYYRSEDIAMVEAIDRLVNAEGYTLKGAEAVLRARAGSPYDRRGNNRGDDQRGPDRRGEGASSAPTDREDHGSLEVVPTPVVAEAITKLGAIRERLSRAIAD